MARLDELGAVLRAARDESLEARAELEPKLDVLAVKLERDFDAIDAAAENVHTVRETLKPNPKT